MANVRPQMKLLLLMTISVGLSNERSLLPLAANENSPPRVTMVNLTLASSDLSALLTELESCATPFAAPTPTMQSPLGVRCSSVVTSIVLPWVALTIGCPLKGISSITQSVSDDVFVPVYLL